MTTEMEAMAARAVQSLPKAAAHSAMPSEFLPRTGAQSAEQSDTETYTNNILGPVSFKIYNLRVAGKSIQQAAPANSPYIIGSDEEFTVAVTIEFNKSPLTELLMCLGTKVCVNFGFEGFGRKATEIDVESCLITYKGQYKYDVVFLGVPDRIDLTAGLYEIGAVATVGPVENKCSTKIWGHGYVQEALLQVYPSDQD